MNIKDLLSIKETNDKSNEIFRDYIRHGNFNEKCDIVDKYKLIDYFRIERQYKYFNLFNENKINIKNLQNFSKRFTTYNNHLLNTFISYYLCSKLLDIDRKLQMNNKFVNKIGQKTQGTTFTISIDGINVVGKVFIDENNNIKDTEQLHESVIGIALNSISHKTPNFMYYYGSYPCQPNIKVKNICKKRDYPGYSLFEYINGKSLGTWLQSIKNEIEVINVYAQIILSLEIAYKELKFTHYDLHKENILIIDLNEEKYITYVHNGKTFSLKSRYLVKIIDYGFSVVEYNNKKYFDKSGEYFEYIGISNSSSPINDFIKISSIILDFIYNKFKNARDIIYSLLSDYITFNTHNDLKEYINEYTPYYETRLQDERILDIFKKLKNSLNIYYVNEALFDSNRFFNQMMIHSSSE